MKKRLTKKRLMMLVLAGLLILGLSGVASGAAGYAFTERESITFSGNTGFVDLQIQSKATFQFDRIQPGERLGVSWWIKNVGPCPLTATVTISGPSWLRKVFYPGYTLNMGPGLWRNVALTVELPSGWSTSKWHAGESFTVTVYFDSVETGNRRETPSYHSGGWN